MMCGMARRTSISLISAHSNAVLVSSILHTLTIANAFHILQGTFPSVISAIFGVIDVDDGFIHRIWLHGYVETKSTVVVTVSESIAIAMANNGRWYKCRNNSRGTSGQERGEEYGDGGAHGELTLFIISS